MIFKLIIGIIFLFTSFLYANPILIDDKTDTYDLLQNSEIYLDKSRSLTLKDILLSQSKFQPNKMKRLSYGYAPDFNLWIKFTLKNTTNKKLNKIIEYANPLTTHIDFFDMSNAHIIKDGLYQLAKNRITINPIFHISLKAHESKTYYIKASSTITTLIVKLKLYNIDTYYADEIKYQVILALFFGSMLILGIYNLFIYFYTRDVSYLYYVLYLFGIIMHHMIYVGIGNIYLLNQTWSIYFIEYSSILVALPIYFLALFTKSFLVTKQYPKHHFILKVLLWFLPISVLVFTLFDSVGKYRNIFTFLLLFYLVYLTVYASYRKNSQAYFILVGWIVIFIASSSMYASSVGIFDIKETIPYLVEVAFILEALIFSIALAYKIKQLEKEKNAINKKLLNQQKNERNQLKVSVDEKTLDLKNALDEKNILLKEVNHRVKNNMQTIVSLIRLQIDDLQADEKIQEILTTTYNRINAMSHLHELLYNKENISNVNANDYFRLLTDHIQESYSENIHLHINISTQLKLEQAIYCGLVLNELITNSFKYAFTSNNGNIYITLSRNESYYLLIVQDDGVGYKQVKSPNSLGLILVNSLVKSKLSGTVETISNKGVKTTIKWKL